MSLRKTIVFLPPYLVTRYDRLAAKHGISRSEALRVAVETSYDTVRQLLASRTAQRRQESPAGGEPASRRQGSKLVDEDLCVGVEPCHASAFAACSGSLAAAPASLRLSSPSWFPGSQSFRQCRRQWPDIFPRASRV